jgi:hypothetical protein
MPESTSEISVGISAAVWETLGAIRDREVSRRSNRGIQGHRYAHTPRSPDPPLRAGAPFFFLLVYGTRVRRVRKVRDAL